MELRRTPIDAPLTLQRARRVHNVRSLGARTPEPRRTPIDAPLTLHRARRAHNVRGIGARTPMDAPRAALS